MKGEKKLTALQVFKVHSQTIKIFLMNKCLNLWIKILKLRNAYECVNTFFFFNVFECVKLDVIKQIVWELFDENKSLHMS